MDEKDLRRSLARNERLRELKATRSRLEEAGADESEIEAVNAHIHGLEGEKEVDPLGQKHSGTPTVSTPEEQPTIPKPLKKSDL